MKTLQIVRMLAVCVTLMAPRVLPGQSCSVPFDTGTVKPSMWDSLVTVLRSFNPKGEAQRLGTLRQRVQQLKDDKHELLGVFMYAKEKPPEDIRIKPMGSR